MSQAPLGISTELVEPDRAFAPKGRVVLGAGFNQPAASRFTARHRTAPLVNITLRDATIDVETGLVFQGDRLLRELGYAPRPGEEASARRRALAATPARDSLVWCGFNRHWRNHFHWLTQCIPGIAGYAADRRWPGGSLLLPDLGSDRLAGLELAGVELAATELVDPAGAVFCESVVFSSMLLHQTAPSLFCRDIFADMARQIAAAGPSAIYISRADSVNRPLLNESDVIELMGSRGIETVVASSLLLVETIALFRGCRLVIGPHGAGLGNIVFCREGSVVYELVPEHYIDSTVGPGINLIAQQQGLHYWVDAHHAHGTFRQFGHLVPWTADLELIGRRLDEIVAAHELGELGRR